MQKYLLSLFVCLAVCSTARGQTTPVTTLTASGSSCVNPTVGSALIVAVGPNYGSASFTINSNAGGNTITFYASGDGGKTYSTLSVTPSNSTTTVISTSTTTAGSVWRAAVSGYTHVCMLMSTQASGNTNVVIYPAFPSASLGGSGGGGGGVTSITGDGTLITNSGSTGAVTLTTATISGTGNICFTTSCVMTTPNLGTPSAVTLTNGTGYLLNNLAAAGGTATIANGNNPILWNWAQTSNSQAGMTFGETSAATGGTVTSSVANQSEISISTASASTATPLSVSQGAITGTTAFPAMQILPNWNNGSLNGIGLLIKSTDTSSGAGSNLIQAMDNTTTEFAVNKAGLLSLMNQFQLSNNSGTLQIMNSGGSVPQPILAGGASYGINGAGGAFGSSIFYGGNYCETSGAPTTLSTGATTTQTGLSCLPANSIIDGVTARVTTTITGSCTGWELGDGTTAARFTANNTGLTSGSTAVAFSGSAWTTGIASTTTGMSQAAATKITITCAGGNPSAGAIRVLVYYHSLTAPTS